MRGKREGMDRQSWKARRDGRDCLAVKEKGLQLNFREPLKWWIFRAFLIMFSLWERRNGHLRVGCRAAELVPGLV